MPKKKHEWLLGEMSPSKRGTAKHFVMPAQHFPEPRILVNATTQGTYCQAEAWANSAQRPGCLDFLRHPSKGTGC